jgi:hypothetical protein
MREIRNIQSIIVEDFNQTFYYFTRSVDIKNPLGIIRATLTEYRISIDEDLATVMYTLYKTAEGFWYDQTYEQDKNFNKVKVAIKSAIDAKEKSKG